MTVTSVSAMQILMMTGSRYTILDVEPADLIEDVKVMIEGQQGRL
jgi:hypothetical protein